MLKRVNLKSSIPSAPCLCNLDFRQTFPHSFKRQYLPHTSIVDIESSKIAFPSRCVKAISLCFLPLMYKYCLGASAGHLEFG